MGFSLKVLFESQLNSFIHVKMPNSRPVVPILVDFVGVLELIPTLNKSEVKSGV